MVEESQEPLKAEVGHPSFINHRARLKERFDKVGVEGLLDYELLELLLFYAIPRKDTKEISKSLIDNFGSLQGVFAAKRESLKEVPNIGTEAARFLVLIRGLSERVLQIKAIRREATISTASDLVRYLSGAMANLSEEQFRVVYVDHANIVIRDEVISRGIEDQTMVYPKQIMKRALTFHATGILVVHNHPTGYLKPSQADKEITNILVAAAQTLEIRFLDHLILGREGKGYFSFREHGLIK
ncbi:DNA repair protein RadC [bacterium]|nr:DNA repair protein RadC [bacterium]